MRIQKLNFNISYWENVMHSVCFPKLTWKLCCHMRGIPTIQGLRFNDKIFNILVGLNIDSLVLFVSLMAMHRAICPEFIWCDRNIFKALQWPTSSWCMRWPKVTWSRHRPFRALLEARRTPPVGEVQFQRPVRSHPSGCFLSLTLSPSMGLTRALEGCWGREWTLRPPPRGRDVVKRGPGAIIVEAGADVNAIDTLGQTPCHVRTSQLPKSCIQIQTDSESGGRREWVMCVFHSIPRFSSLYFKTLLQGTQSLECNVIMKMIMSQKKLSDWVLYIS